MQLELENRLKDLLIRKSELDSELSEVNAEISKVDKELKSIKSVETYPKIIAMIDELFSLPGNEDKTIAILSSVCGESDGGRGILTYGLSDKFTLNSRDESPELSISEDNKWAESIKEYENEEFTSLIDQIINLISKVYDIPPADRIYGDSDSINEYWYGFVALTKDHKLVKFVCREDNMMLNEDEEYPHHVLIDFNK